MLVARSQNLYTMKTKNLLFLFLCCFFFSYAEAAPKAKRVVMIALDGVSVTGVQNAKTPNLDALIKEGAVSYSTRIVMPSVTLPNWTSQLLGAGPEVHGVFDNGWTLDNIKLEAVETDADGYFPSVFKVLKDNVKGIKIAYYYNWAELVYPYNQKYFDELVFSKNDGYVSAYDQAFDFIKENRKEPTVVFLYSGHTDNAGHAHQWESAKYLESIEDADVQIGLLLDKLKADDLYKDTYFMFLSDHGGVGYGHGGMDPREMIVPWSITGPGIKKDFLITEPNNSVNTASTILHLFKVKQPLSWTGEVPESIFK